MTEREVFELAREALKTCNWVDDGGYGHAEYNHVLTSKAIAAIDKVLAQPEQEPVAWMHNHIKGNVIAHRPADIDRHPERWTALYLEPKPCPTCEALARTVMLDQTSHDTTPRQRTWVGLTDKEKSDIWCAVTDRDFVTEDTHVYADAIEAKLKEKNT